MRWKRYVSGLLGAVLALCISVLVLALLLDACGTNAPLMEQLMRKYTTPMTTGLPDKDYGPMAEMITGYIGGTVGEFQYTMTGLLGEEHLAFHADEQQHMADCLALFKLDRTVILVCAALIGVLTVALYCLHKKQSTALGCLIGTILAFVCVAALGIGAAIDFDALFILFHRLSFSNGLWMMNPATDMLIRLMPLPFFIHYVALIGGLWIASLVLMGGVSAWLWRR